MRIVADDGQKAIGVSAGSGSGLAWRIAAEVFARLPEGHDEASRVLTILRGMLEWRMEKRGF